MKKLLIGLLSVLAAFLVVGCAGMTPKTFEGLTLKPNATPSTARMKSKAPLNIVIDQKIPDNVTVTRSQGYVILKVTNFHSAIENTLNKSLEPNFPAVTTSPVETKKGLELIVLNASIGAQADTFDFHVVLVNDGKDVYEYKDQIKPPVKVVGATAFTYQNVLKDLTIEYMESNIKEMGVKVSDKLFINNELSNFWKDL